MHDGADWGKLGSMTTAAERLLVPGPEVDGRLTRSELIITTRSASHELKQQYFASADGTGRQWLAVQYEYRR